jgi:beta-phosphoglucomutase-like phosphatase (HAD superfamily)
MITPIELVIFDCDGVLVDSEPIAVRAYVALGAELGWPLTEAEVIEQFMLSHGQAWCLMTATLLNIAG